MSKKQIRVLIGDDSSEFGMAWASALVARKMYVVTRPKNGQQLLDIIKSDKSFDVAVIEAKMPELSAESLLKALAKSNLRERMPMPIVIVVANYDSPQTEIEVMGAGAKYYLVKPFDSSYLASKILELVNGSMVYTPVPTPDFVSYNIHDAVPDDVEYLITDIIHQIGIPAHIKGYHYLRASILLSVEDPDIMNHITKKLYPMVAKQYQTTPSRVERAIRHAIEIAFDRGNIDTLNSFFGYTIQNAKGKPTNSEFIALIADKLILKFKRNHKKMLATQLPENSMKNQVEIKFKEVSKI
ncbi:MAG: sporulation transcription factor Spo0A [Oscillospiraceae bacterium]|nr:sporulation transcription factor Spo0A [Oscillospiraceae bacterium]